MPLNTDEVAPVPMSSLLLQTKFLNESKFSSNMTIITIALKCALLYVIFRCLALIMSVVRLNNYFLFAKLFFCTK